MKGQVSLIFSTENHLRSDEHLTGRQSVVNNIVTAFRVFLYDLEFSTMTKFFPGLIKAAFQNSVPKSMPRTCDFTCVRIPRIKRRMIFLIDSFKSNVYNTTCKL